MSESQECSARSRARLLRSASSRVGKSSQRRIPQHSCKDELRKSIIEHSGQPSLAKPVRSASARLVIKVPISETQAVHQDFDRSGDQSPGLLD